MNKKLFSWKALAGLALLVAMGLTSCKQSEVVDPTDPVPVKPVTPTAEGTTLSGFKTVAELNTLIAGTKDITDNIKAGGNVTITLDCANLEAAGDTLKLPSKSDATINLVFQNALKKNGGLVISDNALDVVKITFPAGDMGDVSFVMPYTTLTLASAGASTLGNVAFNVNKNNRKELATTIESGVKINAIKTWYEESSAIKFTGQILAKDASAIGAMNIDKVYSTYTSISNNDKGYEIPRVYSNLDNWETVYCKNLNVVDNHVTVWTNLSSTNEIVVEKITIAEGDTATVWGQDAKEIVGLGNGAVLSNFDKGNVKYNNLTINGNQRWYIQAETEKSSFEKCTFVDFNGIYLHQASATGLKFTFDKGSASYTYVRYLVSAAADATTFKYAFDSCEFANGIALEPFAQGENVLGKDGKPIKETRYGYRYYDAAEGVYKTGTANNFTDIPDSIRMGTTKMPSRYWSDNYEPKVVNFNNLSIIPSFKSCKYNDAAISPTNYGLVRWSSIQNGEGKDCATVNKIEIEGKLYKPVATITDGDILVEE